MLFTRVRKTTCDWRGLSRKRREQWTASLSGPSIIPNRIFGRTSRVLLLPLLSAFESYSALRPLSLFCLAKMSSMLFGLFGRKQGSPSSSTSNHESQDRQTQIDSQSASPPPSSTVIEPMQLRTPSPSVDSHSNLAGPSSPGNGIKGTLYRPMSPLQNSLSQLAVHSDSESQSSPEQRSQRLYRLIASVPAITLHQYTLSRLRAATNPSTSPTPEHHLSHATLASVADFFVDLHPPPKLHCVRCHHEYVEVENNDRSCTVAHDDESTLVERVGRGARRGRGGEDGSEYETLWQCCGKTIEGDGDQGPPDGWCYEGKHTVNQTHPQTKPVFPDQPSISRPISSEQDGEQIQHRRTISWSLVSGGTATTFDPDLCLLPQSNPHPQLPFLGSLQSSISARVA